MSLDEVEHGRHLVDAHAGGRLVEHEDLRLQRDAAAPLRACAGRRARGPSARRARLSARRTRSSIASAFSIRSRRRVPDVEQRPAGPGAALHGEAHVLQRVSCGNRLVSWKARPSPVRVRAEAGRRGDVLAVDEHRAGAGAQLAGDQVEVGRLAGAVRADDRRERAGREARTTRR